MQKFNGSLIRQFPSQVTGNAAAGVQVTVYISGTNTIASLFEDNEATPKANPVTTDSVGFYSFKANDNRYRLQFSNGFPAQEISLLDSVQWVSDTESGSGLLGQAASEAVQLINEANTELQAALDGLINTGWFAAAGSFEAGGTITERNQYLQLITTAGADVAGGYSWGGALPKTVTAGSTPTSTGGIGSDAWVYRGDATLRSDLAAPDSTVLVGGVAASALGKYTTAIGECQRLVQKLRFGNNANIIVFSDSTGDATDEWVYLTAVNLATDYPTHTVHYRLWDSGVDNYAAPIVVQTGSGSAVLTVYNAAVAGSIPTRFMGSDLAGAARPGILTEDPDLIFVSYGHNGGNDIPTQYSLLSGFINEVQRLNPLSPVVIIGQNPVTTDNSMQPKVEAFRQVATQRGCGFIDVHAYFIDNLHPLTDFYIDDVHLNAAGSAAWAGLVHSALTYSYKGAGGASNISGGEYLINVFDTFRLMSVGAIINLVTPSRDIALFEGAGESMQLTAAGAPTWSSQFLALDVIDSNDILRFRGRTVSVKVRMQAPEGSGYLTGRIAIYDGTTTITTPNGGPHGNAWYDHVISMRVGAAATYVRIYIYMDDAVGGSVLNVDRITISAGLEAKDGQSIRLNELKKLNIFSGNDDAILTLRNETNGGQAFSVLDTAAGANDDDSSTQYVVSASADGLRIKQRGDSFPRVHIRSDGSASFGNGSALPDIYLQSVGAALLRLVGADFYPEANIEQDCGIAGKAWRRVYGGNTVYTPITAASALTNSVFIDSADGSLKFKNNSGVVSVIST